VRITLPPELADADDTVLVAETQGAIEPIATVFRQAADGSLKLLAQDADVAGGVQAEGDPPNLGYWTNEDGAATWRLQIDHPGRFTVTLEYALDPASPGSQYILTLAGQSLTGTLAVTKGWQDYATVNLGAVALDKGGNVLTIKPAKKPAIGLMNLRSVTLSPAGN
jgi:hypothetical protein